MSDRLGAPATGTGDGGTSSGPGRVLVALYGTFALAAGARAAVQLATQFDEAPLAYLLSAFSAVVYLVATVGLARGGRGGRRTAAVACLVELVGVLVVGTLSLLDRQAFPDATVWSVFGQGYGFIPVVLPVLGLIWLRHLGELDAQAEESPHDEGPGRQGPDDEGSADLPTGTDGSRTD